MTEETKLEDKPVTMEERVEFLEAQVSFLGEAVADLTQHVMAQAGFLNHVFSLTAQREEPESDQPSS